MLQAALDFFATNKDSFLSFGVLTAAIVSAFGAYISFSAQRKNTLGAMRERWIEKLREELSDFISIRWYQRHVKNPAPEQIAEQSIRFNTLRNRILLRLNLEEPDHVDLAKKLEEFRKVLNTTQNKIEFDACEEALRLSARKILRTEWKRASRGS